MNRPQYVILVALTVLVVLTVLAVLGAGLGLFPEAKDSLTKWGPVGTRRLADVQANLPDLAGRPIDPPGLTQPPFRPDAILKSQWQASPSSSPSITKSRPFFHSMTG